MAFPSPGLVFVPSTFSSYGFLFNAVLVLTGVLSESIGEEGSFLSVSCQATSQLRAAAGSHHRESRASLPGLEGACLVGLWGYCTYSLVMTRSEVMERTKLFCVHGSYSQVSTNCCERE